MTGTSDCAGGTSAGAAGAAGGSFAGGGGVAAAGGGGGGGYTGGGQGGGGAGDACGSTAGAGGGGGGTSYAAPGLSAEFVGGDRLNDGQVQVAYSNPVSAAPRSYQTKRDQVLAVSAASGVLSAASGPSGVPLAASVANPPAHGSLALSDDGSFTYTPTAGYAGVDSFTYKVADPSGDYATAQATLRVAAPPSASISTPLSGGTYALGQSVPTSFSCKDGAGGAGLLSCGDSGGAKTTGKGSGHLDTSTLGAHTYTVTAVSEGDLAGTASIAYTVVSVLEPEPGPMPPPPPSPGDPPREPQPRIGLSLSVETESLDELVRRGKLSLVVGVSRAAKVTLAGRAKLAAPGRRAVRTRLVEVFHDKTMRFSGPGKRKVTLVLARSRRRALLGLSELRLAIAGSATDDGGASARRTVSLSLR
ncbi:MAG TPA: cadherin-like domain-containing protein [Solirubrobacterales bacterium]|nr:cadherin-like domain-containing protein [Solirubrobacterales bacterium]